MKIVVPLDLSNVADQAIEPAAEIARAMGDVLVLVTVGGRRIRADLREMAASEHAEIPQMIENHLRTTTARLKGVETEYQLLPGDDAAEALIDLSTKDDIRMIVIATHGRSGFTRWRMGSIADRVVRHSEAPVLVIPTRKA